MSPPQPPSPPPPEDDVARRAAVAASISLLIFALLTGLALVAWFARAPEPLGWKSMVALLSAITGTTTAVLVWRAPSRAHVLLGIAVMIFSLTRIGPPTDWTWVSFTLLSITVLLLVPLVHAALVLRA